MEMRKQRENELKKLKKKASQTITDGNAILTILIPITINLK